MKFLSESGEVSWSAGLAADDAYHVRVAERV
jgi:hypothetical protein